MHWQTSDTVREVILAMGSLVVGGLAWVAWRLMLRSVHDQFCAGKTAPADDGGRAP